MVFKACIIVTDKRNVFVRTSLEKQLDPLDPLGPVAPRGGPYQYFYGNLKPLVVLQRWSSLWIGTCTPDTPPMESSLHLCCSFAVLL